MLDKNTSLHYRMPAEWERQKSTLIGWPYNEKDWPGLFDKIPKVFAKIISRLSLCQKVNVLVKNLNSKKDINFLLKKNKVKLKNIHFIVCKTDRVWMRDTGPIFVKDTQNKNIMCNWKFNGWAKYKNYKHDEKVNQKINSFYKKKIILPKFKKRHVVLEGGSIDVNGKGLLLTTRECLLSKVQKRNLNFKREDYHTIFKRYLGINKVIWLNKGIVGDDTHGHIDGIARFVDQKKIFIAYENNKRDKNYKNLYENLKILTKERKKISNLKIIKIPMPKPIYIGNIRVPATYLNFYISNKFILLPIFNDNKDKIVVNIFKKHFKGRKVIPIDCSNLIWGFGAIHCLTQQEPI